MQPDINLFLQTSLVPICCSSLDYASAGLLLARNNLQCYYVFDSAEVILFSFSQYVNLMNYDNITEMIIPCNINKTDDGVTVLFL